MYFAVHCLPGSSTTFQVKPHVLHLYILIILGYSATVPVNPSETFSPLHNGQCLFISI